MTVGLSCAMMLLRLIIHQERPSDSPLLNIKHDYIVLWMRLPLASSGHPLLCHLL